MTTELHEETTTRDLELPGACVGCGGTITARFSAHGAQGVCLTCRLLTELGLARNGDGVHVQQLPRGEA